MTANDLIAVNAAGVMSTQLLAVCAAVILRYRSSLNKNVERSLLALIGTCLLDAGYQVFQGLQTSIPPNRFPTNVDAADFAFLVGTKTGLDSRTVTVGLAVLAFAWIAGFLVATRFASSALQRRE